MKDIATQAIALALLVLGFACLTYAYATGQSGIIFGTYPNINWGGLGLGIGYLGCALMYQVQRKELRRLREEAS